MSITEPGRARIALILLLSKFVRRSQYRRFVDGLDLKGDEIVLDFGSGWGENTRNIAQKLERGGRVTALDVSRQWQDVIRTKLSKFRNIDLINADVRSAGLTDESFDIIVISYVLHDIPRIERRTIVIELGKKLKRGGFIQLMEPTNKHHGIPPEEVRSLMSSAGLKESSAEERRNVFQARYGRG